MFCGIITDNEFNLIALKNIRKNVILFKLSWYKVFVHKNWNYSIPRCHFSLQKWLSSFQGLFSIKCTACGTHLKEEEENVLLPPCWRTYDDLSPYHYQCRP